MIMSITMVLIAAKKYYFDSYPNTCNRLDYCFLKLSVNFKTLFTPKNPVWKIPVREKLAKSAHARAVPGSDCCWGRGDEGDATLCTISMGIDTFRNFHANHLQIHFDRASFGNEATIGNTFLLLSNYNAFASTALKRSTIWLIWPWNGGNLEDR